MPPASEALTVLPLPRVGKELRLHRQRHKGRLQFNVCLFNGGHREAKVWLLQDGTDARARHILEALPEDVTAEDLTDDFLAACSGGASHYDRESRTEWSRAFEFALSPTLIILPSQVAKRRRRRQTQMLQARM